jgi:anthraniloyl-CoA monooxygenase
VVDRARGRTGAAIAVRLTHAGRRGATRPRRHGTDRPLREGRWPLLGPSPIPYTARSDAPRDLFEHAADVRDDFAAAAAMAAEAGFDALLVDASDGYLLASVISPLSNRRDDEHGGGLGARLRWPLEVLDAVRDAWPADRPLGVRLCVDDRRPGGLTIADGVEIVRRLIDRGIDLLDVAAGHTVPVGLAAPDYRRGYLVGHATTVRNETGAVTLVGGAITTVDEANTILAAGRSDLVTLDPWRYRDPSRERS